LLQDWQPREIPRLLSILEGLQVTDECRASVHQLLETAREKLNALPESQSRFGLECLTEYIARQTELLSAQV
jgi:geranylgeranyl pyrophosphate synthase